MGCILLPCSVKHPETSDLREPEPHQANEVKERIMWQHSWPGFPDRYHVRGLGEVDGL